MADGRAVLGVIHLPILGVTYAGARGLGATRNGAAASSGFRRARRTRSSAPATSRSSMQRAAATIYLRLCSLHGYVRGYTDCFGHGLAIRARSARCWTGPQSLGLPGDAGDRRGGRRFRAHPPSRKRASSTRSSAIALSSRSSLASCPSRRTRRRAAARTGEQAGGDGRDEDDDHQQQEHGVEAGVCFSQPISGSCRIGPMEPKPLMTPAASAAWRRLPTSIAQAPESSASGPIVDEADQAQQRDEDSRRRQPDEPHQHGEDQAAGVIQKMTGVRREPGHAVRPVAGGDHAEQSDPVEGGRQVGGHRRRQREVLAQDQRRPAVERIAQELEAEVDQAHRDDRADEALRQRRLARRRAAPPAAGAATSGSASSASDSPTDCGRSLREAHEARGERRRTRCWSRRRTRPAQPAEQEAGEALAGDAPSW